MVSEVYTIGPWRIEADSQYNRLHTIWGDETILIARTCFAPSSKANARLIAAAPDMLEALREMLDVNELMLRFRDGYSIAREEIAMDMARAAIAKAEGKP